MSEAEGQESTREDVCDRRIEENEVTSINSVCNNIHTVQNSVNDCSTLSLEVRQSIERDFEILKKCAANIDKEVLYSLLLSEMNNSRRLETIMCDMLGIPNAIDLIYQFENAMCTFNGEQDEKEEGTKTEMRKCDSDKFMKQILEIFPDVDHSFLASECKDFKTEEDCSRFINTVMLSGTYPKKNSLEGTWKNPLSDTQDNEVQIIEHVSYKPTVMYSSDEEITSSGIIDSRHGHTKRRKTRTFGSHRSGPVPSTSKGFRNDFVVEEIGSDSDEAILPKVDRRSSQSYSSSHGNSSPMETDAVQFISDGNWEASKGIQQLVQHPPKVSRDSAEIISKSNEHCVDSSDSDLLLLPVNDSICSSKSPNVGRSPNLQSGSESSNDMHAPGTSNTAVRSGETGLNDSFDLVSFRSNGRDMEEFNSPEVSTTSGDVAEFSDMMQDEDLSYPLQEASEEWMGEKTAELIRLFPNTDPSYLRAECAKFQGSLEALNEFVISKLEKNDMPSRADYEKRIEMEELENRYTKNFSIEDFLKVIPDPWSYFKDSNRNCAKYKLHSLVFLKTTFRKLYSRVITSTLMKNKFNLYLTYKELQTKTATPRLRHRCDFECNTQRPTTINIQFLQEVAFIQNENKIKDYIEAREIEKRIKFEEAKKTGSLLECECCFDSEVMAEDAIYCPNDHCFCKSCVIKYVEVEMGLARYEFTCLAGCGDKYTLTSLQNVLRPKIFSKIIQANQMEEIKAAGIEGLVQCPFCSYATIMPPEVKIMTCLNPECQKESCRLCKELSHIPLRCDEVEKSEEVKMRTYIENKMTEALVRTCYKCGKKFVKGEGCNKMVCSCGAKMCYVCRKPVTDYAHFNGQGGTEYHKCPLYSTNDELHVDLVKRVAEEAKAEVLQANPDKTLKYDPTMVLPERSYDQPMPGVNEGAAIAVGLLAVRGQQRNPRQQGQRAAADNNATAQNVHHNVNNHNNRRPVRPNRYFNVQHPSSSKHHCKWPI